MSQKEAHPNYHAAFGGLLWYLQHKSGATCGANISDSSGSMSQGIWMSNQDMCFHNKPLQSFGPLPYIVLETFFNCTRMECSNSDPDGFCHSLPADPLLCCGQIWGHHKGWLEHAKQHESSMLLIVGFIPQYISHKYTPFAKGGLTLLWGKASTS